MNLAEVIATRPGDRLQGPEGWRGVVVCTTVKGVHIEWTHPDKPGSGVTRAMTFTHSQWPRVKPLEKKT